MLYIKKEEIESIYKISVESGYLSNYVYVPEKVTRRLFRKDIVCEEHFESFSGYSQYSLGEILTESSYGTQKYKLVDTKVYVQPSIVIYRPDRSPIVFYIDNIDQAKKYIETLLNKFGLSDVLIDIMI